MDQDIQNRLDYVEMKKWDFRGSEDEDMIIMDTKLEGRFGLSDEDIAEEVTEILEEDLEAPKK